MIFKVPENVKGSFTLNTLSRPLWANVEVSINGNDLYAPDVKAAIKNKMLVPYIEGEYDDMFGVSHKVKVINKAGKTLILGSIILRKGTAQMIDKDVAESSILQGAENEGLIKIVSIDEKVNTDVIKKNKITVNKDIDEEFIIDDEEEDNEEEKVNELREEIEKREKKENETKAQVWDLREQKIKEAEIISKKSDIIEVNEEEEKKDKKKITQKKKTTKKRAKRKTVKKKIKKKVNKSKKKKVKVIEPVGMVKETDNIAIELDSRGNPLNKPSQVLENIINEIAFVDEEQKQEKINKRIIDEE